MKLRTPMLLAGLALVAALGLAGCGADQATTTATDGTTDDYTALDLDADFGGLTATDEAAAFGDIALEQAVLAEADEVADDPLAADPQVAELEALAVATGRFRGAPRGRASRSCASSGACWTAPPIRSARADEGLDLVDWSGRIQVDRGLVIVRRVISFERPRDYPAAPPGPPHRGLGVAHRPAQRRSPDRDPRAAGPARFHRRPAAAQPAAVSGPLPTARNSWSRSWSVSTPPSRSCRQGNAIHFTGFRPDICPRGLPGRFLAGPR